MNQESLSTPLQDYITELLPWAHGHQIKAITAYVAAIIDKQTGMQAALARSFGNQEAACKRVSRLLHNERLKPKELAEAVIHQALSQVPRSGRVRFTIDWTSEADQHLLIISLKVGRRALPIYWRAYSASVLKGRMARYEQAVIKRAFQIMVQHVALKRIRLTADRGFADVELFELIDQWGIRFVIRVKSSTKVWWQGQWCSLGSMRFAGNSHRRSLGRLIYCESAPLPFWVNLCRARDRGGHWQIWYLVSNYARQASWAGEEYGCRFCCEEGFRDAKWYLGFKQARIACIQAWSRLFALFAIALLVLTTLATHLLLHGCGGQPLLRRVVSRRRNRCELSLITIMVSLLHQKWQLLQHLSPLTKFNLEAHLANVS
jgi:Transposase DDE domain